MASTGLLTERQRDRIEGEQQQNDMERHLRKRIRDRGYNAITIDGPILFKDLRPLDRKKIFRAEIVDKDDYTKMGGDEGWDHLGEEFEAMDQGAADFLAFLYLGFTERQLNVGSTGFEDILESAMKGVADQKEWILEEFECTIKFDRNPDFDEMYKEFEEGELPEDGAWELYRNGRIDRDEFTDYVKTRPWAN